MLIKSLTSRIFLSLLTVVLIFSSCKKENSIIGLDVQPESDRINLFSIDTISIKATTVIDDSLSSSSSSYGLLGSYEDLVFGKVKSDFVTQLRLSSNNISFKDGSVMDSIVFHCRVKDSYISDDNPQELKIYEINDQLSDTVTYYSYNRAEYIDNNLTANTTFINTDDTLLSIRLTDDFANKIFTTDSTNLIDNETFLTFIKGIYVTTETVANDGSIIYMDLLSSDSKVTLYYSDTAQYSLDLLINQSCIRINQFDHFNYVGADPNLISYIDNPEIEDTIFYIQPMAGLKGKIEFPNIADFYDKDVVVHKAELIISTENDDLSVSKYPVPEKLYLFSIEEDGVELLPDYSVSADYLNGQFNDDTNTYILNITKYISELIRGDRVNLGLYLNIVSNRVVANRAVLTSGKNSNRIKLKLYCSKI